MKKTLAAVAVLGAFAGSALAANVTLYGIVDTGFQYNHIDYDNVTKADVDKFSMESSQQSGSRFGLKGTEDLGNGLTVGFILENQFNSDDGALYDDDHFFRREASLFLQGGFGKVAFGRMGSINGGTSSWGKIGRINAFSTSWGNASLTAILNGGAIYDNVISYETPNFAGVKVFAQYSMGGNKYEHKYGEEDYEVEDIVGVENESSSDRYYVIGATYDNGPFAAFLSVDSINYKSFYANNYNKDKPDANVDDAVAHDTDDSLTVTLGGSYDFEVAKVYLGAQYFDEINGKFIDTTPGKAKGYAVTLSADAPLAGGKAMFSVGYYDASEADSNTSEFDLSRWNVAAGYNYSLSKRTNVYGVVSYVQDKLEVKGKEDQEPNQLQAMVGLRHTF